MTHFRSDFRKNFKFPSDQSILSILYPMKISISEQMLELRSYSRGKFQERGYEIIYNPLEMIFPLDSIDDVITWFWLYPSWLWPGFPFISSFINKPAYFTNKPSLKYELLDFQEIPNLEGSKSGEYPTLNNHCDPNSIDISSALLTLKIPYYSQIQFEESARDVNNICVTVVTRLIRINKTMGSFLNLKFWLVLKVSVSIW